MGRKLMIGTYIIAGVVVGVDGGFLLGWRARREP